MFKNIMKFFRQFGKKQNEDSKDTAKERLHLVLMQDRANVSADFLDMMRQEIIEVIKKYIDIDEKEIDVRLTNKTNQDGTTGAPALYANIPIVSIKNEIKQNEKELEETDKKEDKKKEEEKVKEQPENKESNIQIKKDEVEEKEQNKKEESGKNKKESK